MPSTPNILTPYAYFHQITPWPGPAAGAELTIPWAYDGRAMMAVLRFVLTTDANAANRIVRVTIDNGTDEIEIGVASASQPASQAAIYASFTHAAASLDTNNYVYSFPLLPFPDIFADYNINIRVGNIQAGDQLSNIIFLMHRWMTEPYT